jgi:hypothetical protein
MGRSNSGFFFSPAYLQACDLFDNSYSGPAVIVYNERGHRIEDEDLDSYPEDDMQSYQNSRRGVAGNGTPPSSRPRTPVNPYYPSNPITGSGSGHRTSTVSTGEEEWRKREQQYQTIMLQPIAPSLSARSVSGAGGIQIRRGRKRGRSEMGMGMKIVRGTEIDRRFILRLLLWTGQEWGWGSAYASSSPMSSKGVLQAGVVLGLCIRHL